MLTTLAWKNIWRNKKRSTVIIAAIALGLWGGLLSGAIMMGMTESMVDSAIDRYIGHVQIHQAGFVEEADLQQRLNNPEQLAADIQKIPGVKSYSPRTIISGMAASPTSSYGARIVGIDTTAEKTVTRLSERLVEGRYLGGKRRNPAIIGKKLSERLHLKLNRKIILTFQGNGGEIIYMACRVVGIFKTESSVFDGSHIFVDRGDLMRILEKETPMVHELTLRCETNAAVPAVLAYLKENHPGLHSESWREVAPELAYMADSSLPFIYLFVAIILAALLFGITNNMLMAVLERTRELGMLTAVGMKRIKIFSMILLETILLAITGGIAGMMVSIVSISYLSHTGIDLSAFSGGLESFGIGTMLYPFLPGNIYVGMTLMIIFAACVAALLPAWKATHLEPVEAIRTY